MRPQACGLTRNVFMRAITCITPALGTPMIGTPRGQPCGAQAERDEREMSRGCGGKALESRFTRAVDVTHRRAHQSQRARRAGNLPGIARRCRDFQRSRRRLARRVAYESSGSRARESWK